MKKLFIAALLIVSVSASALAQNFTPVDKKIVENFEESYRGASNVEWTSTENFAKASFFKNAKKVEVFFNLNGEFIAATTETKLENLPASLKRSLEKRYSNYLVVEAFEYKSYNETTYFISVENQKESIVLKETEGALSVYSKKEKN